MPSLISLLLLINISFSQSEDTFKVAKKNVPVKEIHRSVLLPPYVLVPPGGGTSPLNFCVLDSFLVVGDTIKMNSPEYSIAEYSYVFSAAGRIFKGAGKDGVIDNRFFERMLDARNQKSSLNYLEITRVRNKKGNLMNTTMSYKVSVE